MNEWYVITFVVFIFLDSFLCQQKVFESMDSCLFFSVDDVVSIFISRTDGERIARLVDNGTKVMMRITVGRQVAGFSAINKTSVLFVSISFIVLMIISLAWLVFYYIQRFRYAHAKERLSVNIVSFNVSGTLIFCWRSIAGVELYLSSLAYIYV